MVQFSCLTVQSNMANVNIYFDASRLVIFIAIDAGPLIDVLFIKTCDFPVQIVIHCEGIGIMI